MAKRKPLIAVSLEVVATEAVKNPVTDAPGVNLTCTFDHEGELQTRNRELFMVKEITDKTFDAKALEQFIFNAPYLGDQSRCFTVKTREEKKEMYKAEWKDLVGQPRVRGACESDKDDAPGALTFINPLTPGVKVDSDEADEAFDGFFEDAEPEQTPEQWAIATYKTVEAAKAKKAELLKKKRRTAAEDTELEELENHKF